MSKTIKQAIKNVLNHESIKAADTAIGLQAMRMSTKGYEGESLKGELEIQFNNVYHEGWLSGYKKHMSEVESDESQ